MFYIVNIQQDKQSVCKFILFAKYYNGLVGIGCLNTTCVIMWFTIVDNIPLISVISVLLRSCVILPYTKITFHTVRRKNEFNDEKIEGKN